MRTIGDELISSEVVALIELVKNAYDADASRVLIRFAGPLERGAGGIDVIDDGHGMTRETVEGVFLEPATTFRRSRPRSELLGRRVLGEKGIGRFAVSRLADELELITRRPEAPTETHALFDWRLFDDETAYLDEVPVEIAESAPAEITAGGVSGLLWAGAAPTDPVRLERGTALRMTMLRTSWGESDLGGLHAGLARVISPFPFQVGAGAPEFAIRVEAPRDMPQFTRIVEPSEALQSPHYSLSADISTDGTYELRLALRDVDESRSKKGRIPLGGRQPECGPFRLELRVWDRDQPSMGELAERFGTRATQIRRDLDEAAGVNVYRDGFRVLPYGEPGDDWLQLDRRRVNNPTLRLSNNQVAGYVLISGDANPALRDQTNREGLIQNQAYDDLRQLVLGVLAELEAARYGVRPRQEPRPRERPGRLFEGLNIAALARYAEERYPEDRRLRGLLGEAEETLAEGVERAQEVVARYRRLATLGQLIDKVLHDGRAPLASIRNQALIALGLIARREADCEALLAEADNRLVRIRDQQDALATVFRRIEPFAGRKRGRPATIALEEVLRRTFELAEQDIDRLNVRVELPTGETLVTVDPAELQEVFINLLDNSLRWLATKPREDRRILVEFDRDEEGMHILFSDSGPGVPPDIREQVFDPYFSTAEGGTGLGLTLAGEIVDEYYGGSLDLLDSGPLPGATFRVTLRSRV